MLKIGGSLLKADTLHRCLNGIEQRCQGKAVIVAGGGVFADQVRLAQQQWQFDDNTAHKMAILAMQQMALLFNGIKQHYVIAPSVAAIQTQLRQHDSVIWSPDINELDNAAIAATWAITSDSLAAWLAHALLAKTLILVKSVAVEPPFNWCQLAEKNIVDSAFADFVSAAAFDIQLVTADFFDVAHHQ